MKNVKLEKLREEYKNLQEKVRNKYQEILDLVSQEIKGYKVVNTKTGEFFWVEALALKLSNQGCYTFPTTTLYLKVLDPGEALGVVKYAEKLCAPGTLKKEDAVFIHDYEVYDFNDLGEPFLTFTAFNAWPDYFDVDQGVLSMCLEFQKFEIGTRLGKRLYDQYETQKDSLSRNIDFIKRCR